MNHPVRLQLSRAKGSRLVSPNGLPVVSVARPGKWGNPLLVRILAKSNVNHRGGVVITAPRWYVSRAGVGLEHEACLLCTELDARKLAVAKFRAELLAGALPISVGEVRAVLAGKNLACWCPLGAPCHADVLLCVARGIYS